MIAQWWNEVTATVPGEDSLTERAFGFAEMLMLLSQVGEPAAGTLQLQTGPRPVPEAQESAVQAV